VDPDAVTRAHKITTIALSAPEFSNSFMRFCNKISLRMIGRLANWGRAVNVIRKFDIVIVPGTSTLNDYGSGPLGTSYGLFRWAAAARLCGVKFCFVGTGAGPILHPVSRWMLRSAASWAHYISFRDQNSKDFLASIGIDTSRAPIYPDLVFKLPPPLQAATPDTPITIGIGLMNYNGWIAGARSVSDPTVYQTYIENMGRFVVSLLDRGYRVRLLIGETVDVRAVRDVGAIAKASRHELTERISSPAKAKELISQPINSLHDVMQQVGDTDIVVATRFHNVVCALKLGRPTISIGYEAKNDAVMNDFGLGVFCQSLENLDIEKLDRQLTELLTNKTHYQSVIREHLGAIQLRVKRHEQELLSKIL